MSTPTLTGLLILKDLDISSWASLHTKQFCLRKIRLNLDQKQRNYIFQNETKILQNWQLQIDIANLQKKESEFNKVMNLTNLSHSQ